MSTDLIYFMGVRYRSDNDDPDIPIMSIKIEKFVKSELIPYQRISDFIDDISEPFEIRNQFNFRSSSSNIARTSRRGRGNCLVGDFSKPIPRYIIESLVDGSAYSHYHDSSLKSWYLSYEGAGTIDAAFQLVDDKYYVNPLAYRKYVRKLIIK